MCRSDEQQLQEMYLSRKSFAFNSDRCGRMPPGVGAGAGCIAAASLLLRCQSYLVSRSCVKCPGKASCLESNIKLRSVQARRGRRGQQGWLRVGNEDRRRDLPGPIPHPLLCALETRVVDRASHTATMQPVHCQSLPRGNLFFHTSAAGADAAAACHLQNLDSSKCNLTHVRIAWTATCC